MDIKKILFKTSSIDAEKALPDAMVYVSKEGKILWVNDIAADIFGTPKMHLLTSCLADIIETGLNIVKTALADNSAVIAKAAEAEIYYDMAAREIEEGYVISFRPLNDPSKKEVEKDYTEINREKNNFLIKLSNDLKSPIQSIVGFSQAMTDGLGGSMSEQQDKYIRIINKNSQDLMYFIAKLLELSQTETNIKPLEKRSFDIVALINSVVKFNEQLYKGKEININVVAEEGFKKTVSTDSDILKNIIQDVLEVIFKSVDMGDVDITLTNPTEEYLSERHIVNGNYTLIKISSSALLLSENDLECLFDPYKIVDSTNRKNVLRAIVLASVKNLVASLKGIIWVESQILKNTSFNILLPEI